MIDFLVGAIILAILSLSIGYIVRAKRRGVKCIGCSSGCSSNTGGCSGCHSQCAHDGEDAQK